MNPATASFPRIARFRTPLAFGEYLRQIGVRLPLDEAALSAEEGSPLAEPLQLGPHAVGNRWCIHPMEGWDATAAGTPSETLLRRWRRFGESGAKLIWGGEAVAVQAEGRANPNQLLAPACGKAGFAQLLTSVKTAHQQRFGTTDDFVVSLQLTHSGRFSRPTSAGPSPRIAFHHPVLDARHNVSPDDSTCVIKDAEVEQLINAYVEAAQAAAAAGFQMIDIKACHGYLLHEFLSARRRPGRFGGGFSGRTRLLRDIIERVRVTCPTLTLGVRLSLFDTAPWHRVGDAGQPWPFGDNIPYDCGFGVNETDPRQIDLTEPIKLLHLLADLGVEAINLSAGSPYSTPHIQRPAAFPPSDGYPPPENPLIGVWRQIDAVRQAKEAVPNVVMVGSGYSYLQEYLPHVAQAVIRLGWVDAVGLGRMVLSYPQFPADVLAGKPTARSHICRTFSDCTTAPRNGLRSGCYPLDKYYKTLEPDATAVKAIKQK